MSSNKFTTHGSVFVYDPEPVDERSWEDYNENSKLTKYHKIVPDEIVLRSMDRSKGTTSYDFADAVPLPSINDTACEANLNTLLLKRRSEIPPQRVTLSLEKFSRIIRRACGVTALTNSSGMQHPFRAYPSAGALYPIDIFCITLGVNELGQDLYYYDSTKNILRRLACGISQQRLCEIIVQKSLIDVCVVLFLFVACIERSTFKYGERGYRFSLIEAGHIAQNITLTSLAEERNYLCMGGYFDKRAERLLGIDGVTQTVIYAGALF